MMTISDPNFKEAQELAIRREFQLHHQKYDALSNSIRLVCESRLVIVTCHTIR